MADLARTKLVCALALLALALVPWTALAGTEADPEVTDGTGDTTILGTVPFAGPAAAGVDLVKGWVDSETATELVLAIGLAGQVSLLSPATQYDYTFNLDANGTTHVASAHWTGSFAAGGVATAVAAEGSTIRLTVPKSAVGAFRGDAIGGFFLTSSGTLVMDPLSSQVDRAPDSGTSARTYTVAKGLARGGSAGDSDGDGLNDTKEVKAFGSVGAQDGTGDPDADGLNNTREFALGTDPSKADTDGDGLKDGADPFPLDPARPADSDGDGLNDSWERAHFGNLAQAGPGDPDRDGLSNTREQALGTDPNKADTDGDGVPDDDDSAPLDPDSGAAEEVTREVKPELYGGAALFALAGTFILIGLAKGI